MTSEQLGIIVAVLGLLLGLWQAYGGPRQKRAARQQLLDALPTPTPRSIQIAGETTSQSEADYVIANSLDIATLNSQLAAPPKAIHKALRKLITEGKIEVFIYGPRPRARVRNGWGELVAVIYPAY